MCVLRYAAGGPCLEFRRSNARPRGAHRESLMETRVHFYEFVLQLVSKF